MHDIMDALRSHLPTKFKYQLVKTSADKIRLYPCSANAYFDLQAMRGYFPNVVICGLKSCIRAVINHTKNNRRELLVEGLGLLQVMVTPGVEALKTISNNVMEVEFSPTFFLLAGVWIRLHHVDPAAPTVFPCQ